MLEVETEEPAAHSLDMSPEHRSYLLERASIERELAKSAPDRWTAGLHLEIAARYQVIADSIEVTPKLKLVVNRG